MPLFYPPTSGGGATVSFYEPFPIHNTGTAAQSCGTATSGSLSLYRFFVNVPVAAEGLLMPISMSYVTGGASSLRVSGTMMWGIFTQGNGASSSQLSMFTSSSLSYAMTYNNSTITLAHPTTTNASGVYSSGTTSSAGLNITASYNGLKAFLLGLNTTIPVGDYWLGFLHLRSTTSFSSGILMSLYGNAMTLTGLTPMGSSSVQSTGTQNYQPALAGNWQLAAGSYSLAGLNSIPNVISMSQITANNTIMPYMKFLTRS